MENPKEEPKQETVEYELIQHIKFCLECNNESQAIRLLEKYGFEKQERMYSEEEMLNFAWFLLKNVGQYSDDKTAHFEGKYLEQFKKK